MVMLMHMNISIEPRQSTFGREADELRGGLKRGVWAVRAQCDYLGISSY